MKQTYKILSFVTCMLLVTSAYSQSTSGANTRVGGYFLGWNSGSSGSLDIRNDFNDVINFKTNTNLHATLDANGNFTIGLTNPTNYLGIGGNPIIWHNGDNTSIFVGVGAGASQPASSTLKNTLVGNNAGKALYSSGENTLIGTEAGKSLIDNFDANVAVGYQSLYSNEHWGRNTAVGYKSLYLLNTACGSCDHGSNLNTAVGYETLYHTQAYGGCALGFWAGFSNTYGCSLVAIGEQAAYNNTEGNDNIAIGENALLSNTNLSDNVAIGTGALYSQSYTSVTSCPDPPYYGCISGYNVAVGNDALFSNNPVTDYDGINNTTIGHASLYSNSYGASNTGCGFESGYSNQRGNYNVNIGTVAGYSYTGSHATFVGNAAGFYNSTGDYNSYVGYCAGYSTSSGGYNTFMGLQSGYANTTGSQNSGFGLQVLGQTTTGRCNSALGYKAGYTNTTGSQNTFMGCSADANAGNYSNCGAFGNGATATASNMIEIGNTAVTSIGGYANWTNFSDGRFKTNVQENVSGLNFIKRLRPVTYNLDAAGIEAFLHPNAQSSSPDSLGNSNTCCLGDYTAASNIVHSGFIAQEVEQAELASGFTSSIVKTPANSNDLYALAYGEFVVPLVKAVQELDSINQLLQDQITALQSCCNSNNPQSQKIIGQNNSSNTGSIELQNLNTLQLLDADPNPFSESTMIRWNISVDFNNAVIYFYDNTGSKINSYKIEQKGSGELQVFGSKLSSGVYTYSLIVDSKLIDSKKLVKSK